jgi:hypothetical protein
MKFILETFRMVFPLLAVTLVVVLFLKILNAIPGYLDRGAAPAVVSAADLTEARRIAGWRIVTPAYFPSYLAWPPTAIEVSRVPEVMVKLVITGRQNNRPLLTMYQGSHRAFEVLAEYSAAQTAPGRGVELSKTSAQLSCLTSNLKQLCYLTWVYSGRRFLLVSPLPEPELLRIAASAMR